MKKCPLCDGTGIISRKGESDEDVDRYKQIFKLRKKGLSLRQIGGIVGLAPNTVLYHLNKEKKKKKGTKGRKSKLTDKQKQVLKDSKNLWEMLDEEENKSFNGKQTPAVILAATTQAYHIYRGVCSLFKVKIEGSLSELAFQIGEIVGQEKDLKEQNDQNEKG